MSSAHRKGNLPTILSSEDSTTKWSSRKKEHRTLVEAARTMLNEAKLPLYFWAEEVNTSCYTQNRTLINKDYNKTSYEIMANKKPIVKYFHVFGAKCFTLKDDEQLGKFESKAHEGIFLATHWNLKLTGFM